MKCIRRLQYGISPRSIAFLTSGIIIGWLISFWLRQAFCRTPALGRIQKIESFRVTKARRSSKVYEIDWSRYFELRDRVRILCYVNTIPTTYETKARHVINTWGRQCAKVLFISSAESSELPVINLNLSFPESRKHLWSKMQKALHYLYQYRDQYDFFYKADDDTYATVDNLRYALKDLNPDEPIIAGYPFTHIIRGGHLSGGAGYILSRATLRLLVERGLDKHPQCPTFDEDLEDVKVSMCAYAIGARFESIIDRHSVIPYTTSDLHRNEYRFQWMDLEHLYKWEMPRKKLKNHLPFDPQDPFIRDEHNLLSEFLISLHYVPPANQYTYQFLTYHLKPVGIVYER